MRYKKPFAKKTETMTETLDQGPVWELRKENVAPLKRGRDAAKIGKAFGDHNEKGSEDEEKKAKKASFEAEIQASDDLEPWLRYAKWLDEACPTTTGEAFLVRERCARRFKDDPRYKDDGNYVGVWLRYVEGLEDVLEAYKFMEHKGIGVDRVEFWESWSRAAEDGHRLRDARELLEKGISRGFDDLEKKRANLEARIARLPIEEDVVVSRRPLANVRNARRAVATRPTSGVIPQSSDGPAFALFVDDDLAEPSDLDDDWPDFGTKASRVKENCLPPSRWTDSKLGKRKLLGTKLNASDVPAIFDDDHQEEPSTP